MGQFKIRNIKYLSGNSMKKILFLNFVCNYCPHFETELELMLNLIKEGNEVYSLFCNKILDKFCITNQNFNEEYCNKCCRVYQKGLNIIKFPQKNILKLSEVICPKFPEFKNQEELSEYSIDGVNIGFGVCTSFMSIARDYLFDTIEHKEKIKKYLRSSFIILKNVEKSLQELNFDAVYLFNGRFLEYWPIVELCQKHNIDYYLHERGSSENKYQLVKNDFIHRPQRIRDEMMVSWDKTDEPEKSKIARKWFIDRRNGIEQEWVVFTKFQTKDCLPTFFDKSKDNIAIFNSSLDEYYCFSEWKNPIDENENKIINSILEHYKNDETKHFYLRIHPGLKDISTTQLDELKKIDNLNYPNLTIIWPEDKVDTYALVESCNKVVAFGSTVGVEAAFWGKPSISAGVSLYSHLNCCYNAMTYEQLFDFIDTNLKLKPQEKTYPYGYWAATFGVDFIYFKSKGLFDGTFLGKRIRKSSLFKKAFSKIIKH